MNKAQGWAVAVNGQILVKTVGLTEIAAIVNWLFTPEGGGLTVPDVVPDYEIRKLFEAYSGTRGDVVAIQVTIGGAAAMTKEETAAGSPRAALIQVEWAEVQEIQSVDELIAEGKAVATPWEYKDGFQCGRRRVEQGHD